MDLYEKISILGPSAQYDTCGPKDFGQTTDIPGVYYAQLGGNRVCRLFKVLQTNYCRNNCRYCAWRRDRNCQRITANPAEMAQAFASAFSRRLVDGLFLSSGVIKNAETTMTRMLETAIILRTKYQYRGYLHLKIMPQTSTNCLQEAMKWANRISLNIEAPTEISLTDLAPDKNLRADFFYPLSLIKKARQQRLWAGQKAPSLTTQFVVGAAAETDQEIIRTTHFLYKNFHFQRIFYSAFRPVAGTPLEQKPAVSLTREHRLYQADFLLRFYGFKPWDIPLGPGGNLVASADPKTLWARQHPERFPINLNQAGYDQLLKVPGIGPRSARKIISARQKSKISSLNQLLGQRLQLGKLQNFICL